jgi:hypothetical protein
MLGAGARVGQDWVAWHEAVFWIAWILSALSVLLTGYLGRIMDVVWLGWIPGAVQMVVGFAMGNTLIFVGGLVLIGLGRLLPATHRARGLATEPAGSVCAG